MNIAQIKRIADDFRKNSRWAEVRSDFDMTTTNYRIVGIGRLKVRVMSGAGTIFHVLPEQIKKAW